ncbi:hypothetical protein DFR29_103181 [Tahibacter aquaticus]|jgi:hypothetical protein|uniref:Uncharacterized protein n=1 Tax=Tahibacter aquaticus TaxID=520092 RepID=A0A4R6Z4P0_9GAMM|nr:hypothetical protein [Tahibacter aquaticus]TDR46645.1 hypothetical protein DFR29_103181 [Tahibacter aquaticus]
MWGRAAAGAVPGFFLAAGLVGLVCWCLPGPWQASLVGGLAAFFPLWVGVFCATFLFRTAVAAWSWLSLAAAAALGILWLLQWQQWVL